MPDLVFNELKFLRHPNEHQDENQPDADQRLNHQGKKRAVEREEISTYFNQRASRNHTLKRSPSRRTRTKQRSLRDDEESDGIQVGVSSPILPDEELTAIPYLGFGSKGTVNQSSNLQPSATTYLTWSESATGPDTQTKRVPNWKSTLEPGQLSTAKKAHKRRPERNPVSRPSTDNAESAIRNGPSKPPKGQWSTSRRTRGPAQVEVYVPPSNVGPEPPANTRKRQDSTSLSLPTGPSAVSARPRQQKSMVQQQVLPSDAGSFNTSDILKVRGKLQALADETASSIKSVRAPPSDKENVQTLSSSPTAKVLRIAHEAMARSYEEPATRSLRHANEPYDLFDETGRGYTSHQSGPEGHHSPRAHLRELNNNKLMHQSVQASPVNRGHYFNQLGWQDTEAVSAVVFNPEDDEMLDGNAMLEPQVKDYAYMMPEQASAYAYAPPASHSDMRSLSFRYDRPSTRARGIPWSRGGVSTTLRDTPSHANAAEQGLSVEEDHVGGRDFEDGLKGFWRPNRLY